MSESQRGIRIAIVKGSVRPGNFTSKAVAYLVDEFEGLGVDVDVIDPAKWNLTAPGMPAGDSRADELQSRIKDATGVVLATPEYHGTFSSVMKLPSVLSGKPIALLGVAAGRIGAIKALEHLRSVASHVGGIVLPGPVSLADVRERFDEEGRINDPLVESGVRGVATGLVDYINLNLCPRMCLEEMVRSEAA